MKTRHENYPMKKTIQRFLFLFACFMLSIAPLLAQNCNTLNFTYTTSESRCMATGSVTASVTGGSGNYNYKVTGPVSTSFTSSNNITGLEPGTYELTIRDVNTGCERKQNIVITGSYQDPRFQLAKTDVTCAGNDGTITSGSLQFGLAPFSYTIIAPSPSGVGTTNATGQFTNLVPGEYAIQLRDSCGGIQVRRITIQAYSWSFDNVTGSKTDCNNAQVTVVLKDNKGNLNTSGTSFSGFQYRLTAPVTTSWQPGNTISFAIGTSHTATVEARDNCGNVKSFLWRIPSNQRPNVNTVNISGRTCSGFTATVTGQQNLNGPTYYLYSGSTLIAQNANGEFVNQPYGNYCIRIYDPCYDTTMERCYSATRSLPSVASSVSISNRTCSTITASITGQANLTNADYCLYNAANVLVQPCNKTGVFTGVPYGSYYITINDHGCVDTIFSRSFVENKPMPSLNPLTTSGSSCTSININTNGGSNLFNTPQYCLFDNNGNVITCNTTGVFNNVPHGSYCVRAITSCNDSTAPVCIATTPPTPSVAAAVQISNRTCTTFTASITGQSNLTNPVYCLFDAANNPLLPCNNTGQFDNLPYGSYRITITDGCLGTVITRNFSASLTLPTINGSFTVSNKACNTFTATVTGANLLTPRYYLYDNNNNIYADNTTGIFNNVPYGTYCAEIRDACGNTTARNCQTVAIDKTISVNASKTCNYEYTSMDITFASPNQPYTINIYHPSGALVYNTTTNSATTTVATLPALPDNERYKVVGSDLCSNADSILVLPVAAQISKTVVVNSKCPSSTWQNGSGDLSVTCSSNYYTVTPMLIKKNNATYNASYSSSSGTNFVFSDLEPATYIVQYSMQNCTGKVYDTVTINPYTFPNQSRSAVYQCNDNSFSLSAAVTGGVGPFSYEIIGSTPSSPSIVTTAQSSAIFDINNGTTYSLIRLRSIDACGNAALNDVSVLPLQNIVAKANTTCMYNAVTLSVDTIPNATYEWYKKINSTDSTLLTSSQAYDIPFLQPEETGTYVCRVSINNDCLVRLAYFELTGDCGHTVLPMSVHLKGKTSNAGHQLSWSSLLKDVEFVIERKEQGMTNFLPVGRVKAQSSGGIYMFTDNLPQPGTTVYRLKITGQRTTYSNLVNLTWGSFGIKVYPNPVREAVHISISNNTSADYDIELLTASGQLVHKEQWKNVVQKSFIYKRNSNHKPGIYLLKVINKTDNTFTTYKLLFE